MSKFLDNLTETNALIEQHIHGGFGIDFAKCSAADFIVFSKRIIRYGVCAFFPTLATNSTDNLKRQIAEIKKAIKMQKSDNDSMAVIAGVHLEACFINPAKKGIHDEKQLLTPSIENYAQLEDDIIKIVTLAPELDTNNDLCKYLKSRGVRVSAGHCISSDLSNVDQVTHLYNAMGEFSHRNTSTTVAALANDRIAVELIADFKHVQKDVLKITFRIKPLSKIILISDALPITHSNIESMEFCSKTVFMQDGKAVDASGTMAGSTTFVADIIKGLVQDKLLDLETAVSMASTNITYINNQNSKVYWDKNYNIQAINLNGILTTF